MNDMPNLLNQKRATYLKLKILFIVLSILQKAYSFQDKRYIISKILKLWCLWETDIFSKGWSICQWELCYIWKNDYYLLLNLPDLKDLWWEGTTDCLIKVYTFLYIWSCLWTLCIIHNRNNITKYQLPRNFVQYNKMLSYPGPFFYTT